MKKLISVDLKADFGVLKKPDTNEPMYLTFNMLHKPAVMGIMGAVLGLGGFKEKEKLPEYYQELTDLEIALKPLNTPNGNFRKMIIKYNNATGVANKGEYNEGATLNVVEQVLVSPAFKCFLFLDTENYLLARLDQALKESQAHFVPYLGKNECALWWENYMEHSFEEFTPEGAYKIDSIFIKSDPTLDKIKQDFDSLFGSDFDGSFFYFERLPIGFDEDLIQYKYADFVYSDWHFKRDFLVPYTLLKTGQDEIIQVF